MIFIKDCALTFDNTTKTFVNSLGQESSEIVYFLHNLPVGECTTKRKLAKGKTTAIVARKIDWEKVDKEWYSALTDTKTINLKSKSKDGETQTEIENTILETCAILQQSASTTSSIERTFKAKPKLKVWNNEIKSSLQASRRK